MSNFPTHAVNSTGKPALARQVRDAANVDLRAVPSPTGARRYVGRQQEIVAIFPATYTPGVDILEVDINVDFVPTSAMPRGAVISLTGSHASAIINEMHDSTHVWTKRRIYLTSDTAGVSQRFLVV